MRRYVLGDGQSENMFINWKGFMVSIFYEHSVVGGVVNYKYFIYGVTLPVLKNEIEDFFFARLGTGRTYRYSLRRNVCQPLQRVCEMIQLYEYIVVDKMACAIFDYIFYIYIVSCMLL